MSNDSLDRGGLLLFSEEPELVGELITVAMDLARSIGGKITVLAAGDQAQALTVEATTRGAAQVLHVRAAEGDGSIPEESISIALAKAAKEVQPKIVLVAATRAGAEVAARAAQMLRVPCASSCVSIVADGEGVVSVERRVFGGRFISRQQLPAGAASVVTIAPKRFVRAELVATPSAPVLQFLVSIPPARAVNLGVKPRSQSAVDISKAEVIVGAGRGIKSKADLEILDKLAKTLGGVLAGSRPLTGDVDWLPIDRRVGLSGQTVKPNLYIACGISGQIEHVVGMKGARTVVAINSDAKAPIHQEADYSVIADLYEVVPAIVRCCESARGKVA